MFSLRSFARNSIVVDNQNKSAINLKDQSIFQAKKDQRIQISSEEALSHLEVARPQDNTFLVTAMRGIGPVRIQPELFKDHTEIATISHDPRTKTASVHKLPNKQKYPTKIAQSLNHFLVNRVEKSSDHNSLSFTQKLLRFQSEEEEKEIEQQVAIDLTEDTWNREEHGGVKMWVNNRTREVSIHNPNQRKLEPPLRPRRVSQLSSRVSLKVSSRFGIVSQNVLRRKSILPSSHRKVSMKEELKNLDLAEVLDLLDPKSKLKLSLL